MSQRHYSELDEMKPIFSKTSEIVAGFMEKEAKIVMDRTPLWMFGSDAKLK